MGICTSCYRRNRRRRARDISRLKSTSRTDERQPLLGAAQEANARERYYEYETRWVNTIDALKRGKIPSQEQLNRLFKTTARVLDNVNTTGRSGAGVSEQGRVLLVDLKQTVDALTVWGEQKNYDSKLQTIVHNVRLLSQAQQKPENDYVSILRLLITSGTFRLLMTNIILLFTRHITTKVSSAAQNVEAAAETIETVVQGVENVMQKADAVAHGVDKVAEGVELAAQAALEATTSAVSDGPPQDAANTVAAGAGRVSEGIDDLASGTQPGKSKESKGELDEEERRRVVIESLRAVLLVAHRDRPEHIAAIRTILALSEAYIQDSSSSSSSSQSTPRAEVPPSAPFEVAPELPPSLRTTFSAPPSSAKPSFESSDQLFERTISDLKMVLQRIAGGKSFEGVVESFKKVVSDFRDDTHSPKDEKEVDASAGKHSEDDTSGDDARLVQLSITILRRAVEDPGYIEDATNTGRSWFTKDMEGLMQQWGALAEDEHQSPSERELPVGPPPTLPLPPHQRNHLQAFVLELSSFITSLENDRATKHLVEAFKRLESDFKDYFSETSALTMASSTARMGSYHTRLIKDIAGYVLPRIVGNALSSSTSSSFALPLPLPRVEVKTPGLESVVDMRGMVVNVEREKRVSHKRWWKFWDKTPDEEEEEYWWGDRTSRQWSESPLEDSFYSTITTATTASSVEHEDPRAGGDSWFADLLTPKSVAVKRWEEVVIDFSRGSGGVDAEAEVQGTEGEVNERSPLLRSESSRERERHEQRQGIETAASTTSRAHVTMDGLFVGLPNSSPGRRRRHSYSQTQRTISFENISYYVNYAVSWLSLLGYKDEGTLDLDVTFSSPEGGDKEGVLGGVVDMDVEVDLGSTSSAGDTSKGKGLRIPSLSLTLPRTIQMDVSCGSNQHPLLTSLLLEPVVIPLAQKIARFEAERVAGETLRTTLEEGGNRFLELWGVLRGGEGEEQKGWWKAFMGTEDESSQGEQPPTTTDVDVGFKGVDVTVSEAQEDSTQPTSTSPQPQLEVTVGVAPQIIPSKATPEPPVSVETIVGNVTEDVAEASSKVVEDTAIVTGTVRGILKGVNGTVCGRKKLQVRYQEEDRDSGSLRSFTAGQRREGWRSEAFDW
ncbi:hypothetical protein V5O48_008867 [Marasmius crinis-equi]|uniref:Uncharacterized protein n=1 Tax=Marasmius crinis-equi TaxID=585013 RepID=A0ABR3FD78_9AGAR